MIRFKRVRARPDLATLGGLIIAAVGILGGLMLEGGTLREITQPTAALIVFGGTAGAVLVTAPMHVIRGAVRQLVAVFLEKAPPAEALIEGIAAYAARARREGIVSLEQEVDAIQDPFLRKALNLAVDGAELAEIRRTMELDMAVDEQRTEAEARVFEQAGGYAPTIGILGAVLGLMQVMKHLADIDEVGRGIAMAFVATVYGVGSANLFFLPTAGKIRARAQLAAQMKELMLEGVAGIVEGMNPRLLRARLGAYATESRPGIRRRQRPVRRPTPAEAAASDAALSSR